MLFDDDDDDRAGLTVLDFKNASPSWRTEVVERIDVPYRIWFVVVVIAFIPAVFLEGHHELYTKVAWSVFAPGFTLSQTWKYQKQTIANLVFGVLVLVHIALMQWLFPIFLAESLKPIVVLGFLEIMTIGLAYQVWLHLRFEEKGTETD